MAHGSFVGPLGETSFENVFFNLLLGSNGAHHVGLHVLKNLHGDFSMRLTWLPGGGGTSGADMFMGFGLEQVHFVFDELGVGLVAYRACLIFGNGNDAQFRVDGVVLHGENELGDFGAKAGDGAILAVLVQAMFAGDEDGAAAFVSEGEEPAPELVPGPGLVWALLLRNSSRESMTTSLGLCSLTIFSRQKAKGTSCDCSGSASAPLWYFTS